MEATIITGGGIFCVLVVVLVALAAVAARRRERRRTDAVRSWAQANGWAVTDRPAVDWGARLPGGARDGVSVVLSGVVRGRPVSVGEYMMTETQVSTTSDATGGTSTSTSSNTVHYTVAVARLTQPMPDTTVEQRGGLSRLARAVTGPSESATGNAAFDKAFRIRTANPPAVRAWCTPALIDAHLRGHVPAWSVHGVEVLTYHPGRLDPPAIVSHAERVAYLAALLNPLTPS
jgi:hypothetical protein